MTRVLNLLGCDLPATLLQANVTNEAGHWESLPILQLNDRILQSAGSNWHDWQEFYPEWFRSPKAAQFRDEALSLLASEFGSSHLLVLKDPRICRILPFWLSALEEAEIRPLIVSPLRNPLDVAASLAKRDGFDPSFSSLLWLRNVLDAELASRNVPRIFTAFQGLNENWRGIAQKAQSKLGVVWPCKPDSAANAISTFISDNLQHHKSPPEALFNDPAVSGWLADTYRILSGWIETGELKADYSTLDRIRAEFGAASPAMGRLIAAEQKAASKAKSVATELSQVRDRIIKTEAGLAGETQRAGRFEQELTTAKNALAEKDKRIAALSNELTVQGQAAEKVWADVNAQLQQTQVARASEAQRASRFEQELTAVKAALAEREKKIAALAGDLTAQAQAAEKIHADVNERLLQAEAARANEAQRAGLIEQELATVRNTLADREKRLAALTSDLRLKTQATEVAQASIVELGGRVQKAETERANQSHRAGQFERELVAVKGTLSEKEQNIAALTVELALQTQAAGQMQSRLVEVTNQLQAMTDAHASDSEQARQLEYELEVAKNALNEKESQLAALANELSLLAQASERMAEAGAAELLRTEMLEQALEALRNELTGKDNHVAALAERVAFHERSAQDAQAGLFRVESEMTDVVQRSTKLEHELQTARHLIDKRDDQIVALVAELERRMQAFESEMASQAQLSGKLEYELEVARNVVNKKDDQIAALATEFEQRVKILESDLAGEAQRAKHFQHEAGKAKGSLAESEKRIAALAEELKTHTQARSKAEAALAEAQSRLAQTESALIQRRHEADQTAQELAKAQAELRQMAASATQNEKLVTGLKDHVNLLMADFKERQGQIEVLDKKIREQEPAISQLKRLLEDREKTVAQLQGKQREHLDETVKLSRLAIDREQQANAEAEKARLIREVAAKELGKSIVALLDNHKWSLLPRRVRLKRQMALLDRIGLFDREWYLEHYHDVRESGMDPLRHYAEYGAREGREPNSKFERPKQ